MKKIILHLLLLFLAGQTLAAQDSLAVKKQTFDQAFDYFGAEFMKAYMVYTAKNPGKASKADLDGWANKIKPVLTGNTIQKPVSSEELAGLLKNNGWVWVGAEIHGPVLAAQKKYSPSWGKNELISFFSRDIFKQKCRDKTVNDYFRGTDKEKKELTDAIGVFIESSFSKKTSPDDTVAVVPEPAGIDTGANAAIDTTSVKPPVGNPLTGSSGMGLLLFIPVAIALALLGFKVMQQAGTIGRMEIQMAKLISIANGTSPDGASVAELKEEHGKRLNKLDESLSKIQDKLAGITQKPGPASYEQPDKTHGAAPAVGDMPSGNLPPHFYMPAPDKEGNFSASDASPSIYVTKTIFKFTPLNTEGTEASVEIVQHDQVFQTFFNTPSVYLPACEALNSNQGKDAKKIMNEEKGRAVKQGSIWAIKKPVKIRYE